MTDEPRRTLRVGITAPVQSLDPRGTTDWVNQFVLNQIFERPYFAPSGDRHPEPEIFSELLKIESNRGEQTRFSAPIRQGVKFSDGTEMTPDHVYNSLESCQALRNRATVELRDESLFFTLDRPDPHFGHALSNPEFVVYKVSGGSVLGTGPYQLADGSKPGAEELCLELNPYYRENPGIQKIIVRTYPRETNGAPTKLLDAIADGKVDLTFSLSKTDAQNLSVTGLRKHIELSNSTAILFLNVTRPWLDQAVARQAIALAVNRSALTELFYSSTMTFSASGLLPPALGSMPDMIYYNIAKARALIEKAGGPPSEPLTMVLIPKARPYLPNPARAAQLISEQLQEIGVEIQIQPTSDVEEYSKKCAAGSYDLVLAGFVSDTPNPADFLDSVLSSRSVPERDGTIMTLVNLSRWCNSEMDEAIDHYRAMPSNDARKRGIVRILREEIPLVPLMYGPLVTVHSTRVLGIQKSFQGFPSFAKLSVR